VKVIGLFRETNEMKTSGSKCTQGVMEISEDEESKILLLPGNLLIKIPYKNTQS